MIAATYVASSSAAGVLIGFLLAYVGRGLPQPARAVTGVIASSALVTVAILLEAGVAVPLPQRDQETPQRWVSLGGLCWGLLNGFSLGLGFTTRIGVWLWYALPVGVLVLGRPALGALMYGLYGLTRGAGVAVLLTLNLLRPGRVDT